MESKTKDSSRRRYPPSRAWHCWVIMDTKGNAANFWTAVLGLVAAVVTLLAAIGGTAGFFQGGDKTADGEGSGAGTKTAAATLTSTPSPTRSPTPSQTPSPKTQPATATPTPSPMVWLKGTLEIPVSSDNDGQMADFDAGELIRVEKSEEARDADLGVSVDGDELVLEPGAGKPDGAAFYARFVTIGDEAAGREGCADRESGPGVSSPLLFPTEVEVGSHVCMVTTEGRIAEFEILGAKLTGRQRWLEVRYTTWAD